MVKYKKSTKDPPMTRYLTRILQFTDKDFLAVNENMGSLSMQIQGVQKNMICKRPTARGFTTPTNHTKNKNDIRNHSLYAQKEIYSQNDEYLVILSQPR